MTNVFIFGIPVLCTVLILFSYQRKLRYVAPAMFSLAMIGLAGYLMIAIYFMWFLTQWREN